MSEKRRQTEEQPLSEILKRFIRVNRLEKGISQVQIEEAWKKMMGPAVSKYTNKILLQKTTLYIQLTSSVLTQELSYGKSKIISNLNEELGWNAVEKLVFR